MGREFGHGRPIFFGYFNFISHKKTLLHCNKVYMEPYTQIYPHHRMQGPPRMYYLKADEFISLVEKYEEENVQEDEEVENTFWALYRPVATAVATSAVATSAAPVTCAAARICLHPRGAWACLTSWDIHGPTRTARLIRYAVGDYWAWPAPGRMPSDAPPAAGPDRVCVAGAARRT